jgi:hypothetical protein
MNPEEMYELMVEATRQAIRDELHSDDCRMSRRMFGGKITFEDGEGRLVKEIDVLTLFKKVTSVREKLRVLEQKINNHPTLVAHEKAELQAYISRGFGSLTTFNFLFHRDEDKFKGTRG